MTLALTDQPTSFMRALDHHRKGNKKEAYRGSSEGI